MNAREVKRYDLPYELAQIKLRTGIKHWYLASVLEG
jgi:hypothetical protein